jgi:formylglycine-generating enzyme required for sulfatase activity
VTIERAFDLGRSPVTQRQWESLSGGNPSHFGLSGDHPVDSVSWPDAVLFCQRASERSGRCVRLPSEAEWEYACRAGSRDEFFFCDEGPFCDENAIPHEVRVQLHEFAWFDENSLETTHAVGTKRANLWGLHDMIGNVWEWCQDHWHADYRGAPANGNPWLDGPEAKPRRCLRGGAWDMNAFRCRSCYRSWDWETLATDRFGLRICVEV